jgi:putative FmdB family regulatory protein
MYYENAKCDDCNHEYEISKKKIIDDFVSGKCPKCGSENTRRLFGMPGFNIAIGKVGNSTTNYDNEVVYKPSGMGKYKGTKV